MGERLFPEWGESMFAPNSNPKRLPNCGAEITTAKLRPQTLHNTTWRKVRCADRPWCFATGGGAIKSIGNSTSLASLTAATTYVSR